MERLIRPLKVHWEIAERLLKDHFPERPLKDCFEPFQKVLETTETTKTTERSARNRERPRRSLKVHWKTIERSSFHGLSAVFQRSCSLWNGGLGSALTRYIGIAAANFKFTKMHDAIKNMSGILQLSWPEPPVMLFQPIWSDSGSKYFRVNKTKWQMVSDDRQINWKIVSHHAHKSTIQYHNSRLMFLGNSEQRLDAWPFLGP